MTKVMRDFCVHAVPLLALLLSSQAAFCPSWTSSQCPLADNAMERFEKELSENMAGQPQAFHAIRKALARNVDKFTGLNPNPPNVQSFRRTWRKLDNAVGIGNMLDTSAAHALDGALNFFGGIGSSTPEPSPTDRPLFMHFSGPTGVGKSMTADVIARSLFKEQFDSARELCGRLYFLMRAFASHKPSDMKRNLEEIRRKVAEQLYHCPRSVIVFDEVQAVPEAVLDGTIDIFDHEGESGVLSFEGTPVQTSSCVVIVISDMGSIKLSPDMSRIAARQAVEQDAQERFVSSRKAALLNNTVPFLPLSVEELVQVAQMELKELSARLAREYRGQWGGAITWHKEVPTWLAESCFADPTCYDDGGRGVETKVTHEVLTVVEDALLAELPDAVSKDCVSYNNIDLTVAEEGEELQAAVDTVFDAEREFREL